MLNRMYSRFWLRAGSASTGGKVTHRRPTLPARNALWGSRGTALGGESPHRSAFGYISLDLFGAQPDRSGFPLAAWRRRESRTIRELRHR